MPVIYSEKDVGEIFDFGRFVLQLLTFQSTRKRGWLAAIADWGGSVFDTEVWKIPVQRI